jgi:hypothetical protein
MSRKVQELKREIDTDKERNLNLVCLTLHIVLHHISICSLQEHVHHLFQEVFQMTKDEDFLLANGLSAEDLNCSPRQARVVQTLLIFIGTLITLHHRTGTRWLSACLYASWLSCVRRKNGPRHQRRTPIGWRRSLKSAIVSEL